MSTDSRDSFASCPLPSSTDHPSRRQDSAWSASASRFLLVFTPSPRRLLRTRICITITNDHNCVPACFMGRDTERATKLRTASALFAASTSEGPTSSPRLEYDSVESFHITGAQLAKRLSRADHTGKHQNSEPLSSSSTMQRRIRSRHARRVHEHVQTIERAGQSSRSRIENRSLDERMGWGGLDECGWTHGWMFLDARHRLRGRRIGHGHG
jgi:hypothetical protein